MKILKTKYKKNGYGVLKGKRLKAFKLACDEQSAKDTDVLTKTTVLSIFNLESHPLWEPLITDARIKMASRDYGFREAFHFKLQKYIQAVSPDDFERFLGEKSKELGERIKETQEALEQLKN